MVVVVDVDISRAWTTVQEIADGSGNAIAVEFDLTDADSVQVLVDTAVQKYGRINAAFINGADLSVDTIGRDADLVDLDLEVWNRTIAVNLRGHMLTARAVIPRILECGGGFDRLHIVECITDG